MICKKCEEYYETENSEVHWEYESGCDVKLSKCPYCGNKNVVKRKWLKDYQTHYELGEDILKGIKEGFLNR